MHLQGFRVVREERVRQRCEFLTREELIQIYRDLLGKAKIGNPFHFGCDFKISGFERIALKIFEELGLIRCLGGTDEIVLEWVPAQSKLDLDASLRYRNSKERVDRALTFQGELLKATLNRNE